MQDCPLSPLMMQVAGTHSTKLPFFAAVVIVDHTLTIARNGEHTHDVNIQANAPSLLLPQSSVQKGCVYVCVCVCVEGGGLVFFREYGIHGIHIASSQFRLSYTGVKIY